MGHYLSDIESTKEAQKRADYAQDIKDRLNAGFTYHWSTDYWLCSGCECLIPGDRWQNHIEKVHN